MINKLIKNSLEGLYGPLFISKFKEMLFMLEIQKRLSAYNFSSRNGSSIKYLVLHYTGNKGDTANDNATYFGGGNRNLLMITKLYKL